MSIRQRSVYHATHSGPASGSGIDLSHVQKGGWFNISSENMMVVQCDHVVKQNTEDDASDVAKDVTSDSITS